MRLAIAVAALLLVLVLAVVLFLGFVPAGKRMTADMVSSLISGPDQRITISPPDGLLTGRLHIDEVTVSDSGGPYAAARDITVDWSPLSLLRATFHADSIDIASLSVTRPPIETAQPAPTNEQTSSGGSSLPVNIEIDAIRLPDISLGPALTGRQFDLAAEGAVNATGERVAVKVSAHRKDTPDASATADIVFAPGQNELKLQALVAEPQGGLLARLLRLPQTPSVSLALDGQGPLSNWTGQLRGTVDGKPVIGMDGQHTMTPEGIHQLQIHGGGQLAELLPPTLRPLFVGRSDINVGALVSGNGRIEIKKGELSTGAVKLSAAGALDPSGDNSLTGSIATTNGPVDIEWPMNGGPARFAVDNLNFTLTGPADASRFNATASLRSVSAMGASFEQVRLQAESEDLDLVQRAGSIRTRLSAARADFANPDIDRLVDGPIRLDAPIRLALPAIGLDASTFESANVSGTVSGAYNLAKQSITGNVRVSLNPDGLPEAVGRNFEDMIGLEGYVDAVIGGKTSLENLVLKSGLVDGHGNLLLENGTLDAHLAGRLADIARFRKDAKGAVGYDVKVTGPLDALAATAVLNAAELRASGHALQGMTARFDGAVTGAAPGGTLQAAGNIDGKPIRLQTDVRRADEQISIANLVVEAGTNRLTGGVTLSPQFRPAGQLDFDLPDLGLLASLAGQKVGGDLRGTVTFASTPDLITATLKASGQTVTAQGVTIDTPNIDLVSGNLAGLSAEGTIRAGRIGTGAQAIDNAMLTLSQTASRTGFDLAAQYGGQPLTLAGALDQATAGAMTLSIDRFSASPGGVPVALTEPAQIGIAGGTVNLGSIVLTAGGGRVVVEGTAAERLNLAVRIGELPAALANGFVSGIGAEGTIGGVVTVAGTTADPLIRYSAEWTGAELAQTRAQGLQPFGLAARGRFQNGTVTLDDVKLENGDGLAATASGTIGTADPQPLDLTVRLAALPAALADRFVPNLGAEGIVTGTAAIKGTVAAPAATFDLALPDGSVAALRTAGLDRLSATAKGRFEGRTLTLDSLAVTGKEGLSLTADGSLDLSGDRPLSMNGTLAAVPAALVNTFRPDLGAQGLLSGTLTASGTLAAPQARFALDWADASLAQTRAARLDGLSVAVKGSFANQLVTIDTARLTGQNGLSLTASGTAQLAGDRPINLSAQFARLPAALADIARPDLKAAGSLDGTITAAGTLSAPALRYDVTLADGSTAQTREANVNALGLRAQGSFENGILTLEQTQLSDPSGLSVTAQGRVLLNGPQGPALDLNANIAALPANLANAFSPGLGAGGTISGSISSSGTPDAPTARFDLAWQDAALRQTVDAGLKGLAVQARGAIANGTLTLEQAGITGPSGLEATATGTVGLAGDRPLALTANIASLPASLAGAFVPNVEAGGTISGTATVNGSVAAPAIRYDLQWADGAIRRQGDAGVGGLNLKAAGQFENGRLALGETRLSGPNGLSLTANGSVTLGGQAGPVLDLNADINSLPASLANAFVPGLGATGEITGKITALPGAGVSGARFDLAWSGASLAQTRTAGLAPFRIAANGTADTSRVTFDARLTGAGGLALSGGGSVGLTGDRALDLSVNGDLPFALAAAQLAGQGLVLNGTGRVNVKVGGTVAAPIVTGSASTSGARIVDVRRNLALNNIAAAISFDRDRATITNLSASVSTGGRLTVQGSVGLRDGFAADLRVGLDNATYVDGNLVTATVNGQLTVTGPLLQGPTLGGTVTLVRANITVPARLPASLAEIDVKHRNPPPDVRALLAAMRPKGGTGTSAGINLDLTLNAPNGIFVRGRGIDAELGGTLTVRGTTAAPDVSGGFQMRRGRIVILTKRLDFTTGKITFSGGLIPVLDLIASTSSGQTTINIAVSGLANDPEVSFSSAPALPQDEVLAQLIFGQSMARLSPLQIAQLADAASQLAGGGSTSLLQTLRATLGVDDIDINTDDTGQTSVSVGRYLNNRTYLQLEQGGAEGGANASINLDVGRGVKLKGSAGSDGGSAGIFYEREY
ncbi:translocation/assembly module TamB domain-containing protein [Rhizobium sp. SAFR-030]|uniref:translocation/assembly module TamB domain-containing protein n=1 Tax=Rhizobium sp. SAFR-030 TaxID=3387277 RepID=UPI003F7FFF46